MYFKTLLKHSGSTMQAAVGVFFYVSVTLRPPLDVQSGAPERFLLSAERRDG